VQLTRLPMGSRVGPEVLHTVTCVIAGDRGVVKPQYASAPALSITVWIDNVRAAGNRGEVLKWFGATLRTAAYVGATIGEGTALEDECSFEGKCVLTMRIVPHECATSLLAI
jgi:hypothetical protein